MSSTIHHFAGGLHGGQHRGQHLFTIYQYFFNIGGYSATLFIYILFYRLVLHEFIFYIHYFAGGLHGGVDVKCMVWRLACYGSALT